MNEERQGNIANTMLAEVPVRIQRSRQNKQVSPNGLQIAYVGRGTRWGNPFRLVKYLDGKWAIKTDGSDRCNELLIKHCHAVYDTRNAAAIDAINCYDFWLLPYTHKKGSMMEFYQSMAIMDDAMQNLKGKNLACWCRLDESCHADLLLTLVNRYQVTTGIAAVQNRSRLKNKCKPNDMKQNRITSDRHSSNTLVSGSADLDFVNSQIKKIENAENIKYYYSKNRDKQKEKNKKWDKDNRREYQKNYRKMNGR